MSVIMSPHITRSDASMEPIEHSDSSSETQELSVQFSFSHKKKKKEKKTALSDKSVKLSKLELKQE